MNGQKMYTNNTYNIQLPVVSSLGSKKNLKKSMADYELVLPYLIGGVHVKQRSPIGSACFIGCGSTHGFDWVPAPGVPTREPPMSQGGAVRCLENRPKSLTVQFKGYVSAGFLMIARVSPHGNWINRVSLFIAYIDFPWCLYKGNQRRFPVFYGN